MIKMVTSLKPFFFFQSGMLDRIVFAESKRLDVIFKFIDIANAQ